MYTEEQIRKAGIDGEINSTDVEHLINILKERHRIYDEDEDDYNERDYDDDYDDDYDPLESIAENCTCGAYQIGKDGKYKHVSDCIC